MQKTSPLLLLIILLSGMFSYSQTSQEESSWTSMNPLSIPLKIRQAYYNKGNLVPNPSFEQVKILKNDKLIYNFDLTQWNVIGKNVQLTDNTKRGVYNNAEAFKGIHAIKIVRTDQNVKEINNQSEGVLSDFIEVIPGNYDFNFDIRLNRIIPTSIIDRFQTRIGKNIDIHLKFYDKNKKELDPAVYFEYINKKIDNSFKGFAFSNYFFIDKFDWANVHGRTWDYPFSEGDLPDKCTYIKIFLGLKCSGTMWVDNIDFRLSRWNFTPVERMDSMFKKNYDLTELMIPTPQVVENKQHIELKNRNIKLVYGGIESPETKVTLALLQKRFSRVHGDLIKIYKSESSLQGSEDLQIILIDNHPPASQFEDAFQAIKNKDQGYFIRKDGNKIYLGSNQAKGLFYAASSLCQLVDYTNSILDYADITDFPDFLGRSTKMMGTADRPQTDSVMAELEKQTQDVDFYAFYKINKIYDTYGGSKSWWLQGDFYKTIYQKLGERCAQYGDIIHTAVQLNPYYHLEIQQEYTLSDSIRDLFSHGTDAGFEKIKNALKPALDAGAKTVMLCADDYVPRSGTMHGEFTLFTKSDKAKFTNLADAHNYLINRLKSWLDMEYGNIRLEFVPAPYSNWFIDFGRGSAETYFSDLASHLDPSVVLVWTGPTVRSLSYDMADIRRGTEVYKRKPMIWDNSPYARNIYKGWQGGYPTFYPQKSVMCNLFEPFDIQYPKNFPTYLNSDYYSNLGGFGEIPRIKYMTFADFTWNTKDYNSDFSLFKALVQYVGRENAKLLLKFNDTFYQFVSSWSQLRIDIEHAPDFKCSEKQKNQAEQEIKALKTAFNALKSIDNETLKNELENEMNSKIDDWHKLSVTTSIQNGNKK